MIARVTACETSSDNLDEVIKSFKKSDIPAAKSQKGFLGCYLLTDRKTGKFISISFWRSENDVITDEQSGQYQQRVDIRKHLYTTPPVHKLYEVSARY